MRRLILAYIPSNAVPALVSFATIYAYTRLLGVRDYGDYSLAFSAVMVGQAALFYPLSLGASRLYPQAEQEGTLPAFLKAAYSCLALIALGIAVLGLPPLLLVPLPGGMRLALALAVPLLILRGTVALDQGVHQMRTHVARYNAIECAQAALGLAAGVGLAWAWKDLGAAAVMVGLVVGSAACAAADLPLLVSSLRPRGPRRARLERGLAIELLRFGWPLSLAYLTSFLLQYGDRFLVGGLAGAGTLGIYAVAYSLVERPTTLLCTSVTTATFPLAVRALERDGIEAGGVQAGRNGAALLALAVPACIGLALTAKHIAAVMVGTEYRAGTAALIPIMAFTALARGIATHFVDHAFHLARRPDVMLRIYAPAAALNIAADAVAIPLFGVFAAAWAALACQVGVLAAGWMVGRRYFPLFLPQREVASVLAATAAMAAVLLAVQVPETLAGLATLVGAGGLAYGAALLALQGRRALRLARWRPRAKVRLG